MRADVVTEWNIVALMSFARRASPPRASRALAILHAAIYDAVNGIARTHSVRARTVPASASIEAAASAAAHGFWCRCSPGCNGSMQFIGRSLPGFVVLRRGPEWPGADWSPPILDGRANDGSDAAVAPPVTSARQLGADAARVCSYLFPQWGFVTPFALPNRGRPATRAARAHSERWAADYNEVKALGAAVGSARTAEQTRIALFWADGAGTETPPGHWNHIARDLGSWGIRWSRTRVCLRFSIWRWPTPPFGPGMRSTTSILAAGDCHPLRGQRRESRRRATWSSLIATPPFPDYVSGHSTFSGAAATVLALFYGTDDIAFNTGSDALPGVYRFFGSFSGAARKQP